MLNGEEINREIVVKERLTGYPSIGEVVKAVSGFLGERGEGVG
jgi:hypothetical protein